MQRCTSLPGEELFQYVDDGGALHKIGSDDVNAYLRDAGDGEFSAKDFRTWAGTVIAAHTLSGLDPQDAPAEERSRFQRAVIEASSQLGNTPAVCRRSYIHPMVFTAFSDGSLAQLSFGARTPVVVDARRVRSGLRAEERATLRLLKEKTRTRRGTSGSK
jgi:DNA topoisomerase-1